MASTQLKSTAPEAAWFADVTRLIEAGRKIRDAWEERVFELLYGENGVLSASTDTRPERVRLTFPS